MAWTAPRTWVAGEVPTAAIFNTHVRDNLLALDPTAATTSVTAATNVTSTSCAVTARGGFVWVNVNATANAALVSGDTLFTLPVGYRPPVLSFVTLMITGTNAAIRVHVDTAGVVTTQQSIGSGVIIRGSFVVALA